MLVDADEPAADEPAADEAGALVAGDTDPHPASWRDAMVEVHQQGFVYLDVLTVVDRTNLATSESGPWELLAHVVRPSDRARRWVRRVQIEPQIESIADVFAAADWHEREISEMFGIDVIGNHRGGDRPLLLVRGGAADEPPAATAAHPLRKRTPLAVRVATPWPGVHEPGGEAKSARRSRRTQRPPGVPPGWMSDLPEGSDRHVRERP